MSTIYDSMLSMYNLTTPESKRNATFEVCQQIALSGLADGGFFNKAAFYGGTCLRIFHNLNRFSEDMDFSLLTQDETFNFESYFPSIIDAFSAVGREHVEITKKNKKNFGCVESAFLKDDTDIYDVTFKTERAIRIKIEVDTYPPINFSTEQKLMLMPKSTLVRCYTLPDLFAGKIHALVYRDWKNRVKGRDWYDFEWYVRHGVKLNFEHLYERIKQFNNKEITRDEFQIILENKLRTTNIEMVKADVRPFIKNEEELNVWSNEYFIQLANMIKFE